MTTDPTPDPLWTIRRIGVSCWVVTHNGEFHSSHATYADAWEATAALERIA